VISKLKKYIDPKLGITSDVTELAYKIAKESISEEILEHSIRSFLLAHAYGKQENLHYDIECLFIASLFHDVGLFPPFLNKTQPFTSSSCNAVTMFLSNQIEAEKINLINNAIKYHFRPFPKWDVGVEVGLLQIGTWMDVTGIRCWRIWREWIKINAAHNQRSPTNSVIRTVVNSFGNIHSCCGLFFDDKT